MRSLSFLALAICAILTGCDDVETNALGDPKTEVSKAPQWKGKCSGSDPTDCQYSISLGGGWKGIIKHRAASNSPNGPYREVYVFYLDFPKKIKSEPYQWTVNAFSGEDRIPVIFDRDFTGPDKGWFVRPASIEVYGLNKLPTISGDRAAIESLIIEKEIKFSFSTGESIIIPPSNFPSLIIKSMEGTILEANSSIASNRRPRFPTFQEIEQNKKEIAEKREEVYERIRQRNVERQRTSAPTTNRGNTAADVAALLAAGAALANAINGYNNAGSASSTASGSVSCDFTCNPRDTQCIARHKALCQ